MVDSEQMLKFLNVDKAKLQSKGVDSVKSRVTNLKEYNADITVESMCKQIKISAEKIYNCSAVDYVINSVDKLKINELMQNLATGIGFLDGKYNLQIICKDVSHGEMWNFIFM